MNNLEIIDNKKIDSMIYAIRGVQVILDKDLAFLYETETKKINQAVKRNKDRFPDNFCFQLTENEYLSLRSQFVTSKSKDNRGGVRYLPYAFTEQGVAMLSSLLKTDKAIKTSIVIMNAFVEMRKFISSNLLEQKYINSLVLEHDNDIKLLKETFSKFDSISNEIFFDGQVYDAYSLLLNIINGAKDSIIVIDNYLSKELLDILSKTNKDIVVYSKNINNTLISKYNSEYHNVFFKIDNRFHDRFIIIDKKEVYHSGASFKDLGKKCFAISKIKDEKIINNLLNRLSD